MIRDQEERTIGKLIEVNTNRGIIELSQHEANFIVTGFDDVHRFAQINSYVTIPHGSSLIVALVLGVREVPQHYLEPAQGKSSALRQDLIEVSFVGEIITGREQKRFQFGISSYPHLYSNVLYIRDDELDVIFKVHEREIEDIQDRTKTRLKTLSIGTSSVFPTYSVKVDLDGFFNKHSAILGNTGSGKSCTIASILQSLYEKKDYSASGSTFIILDTNGEYLQALESLGNDTIVVRHLSPEHSKSQRTGNIIRQPFVLPHWFLDFDEWALLLQASEKVQLPVLRSAISLGQIFESNKKDEGKYVDHILARCVSQIMASDQGALSKVQRIKTLIGGHPTMNFNITVDAFKFDKYGNLENEDDFNSIVSKCTLEEPKLPSPRKGERFQFDDLEKLLDFAILYEESYGRANIRNFCSSLQLRAQSLLTRDDYDFLKGSSISVSDYMMTLLGLATKQRKLRKFSQIVILDLSMYPDEIIEVIASVLSRITFETLQHAQPRNEFPVHIVVEEAHRFISEKDSDHVFQAKQIFERIAKEGRKYGLSLIVSSQRPSELSKTVLSQCSNFIVHRIMNPEDLAYIRKMTPYISQEVLDELPYMPRQQALVFGSAVNIPMMFKVRDANPRPRSDDNRVSEHWFKPADHIVSTKFNRR